MYPFFKSHYSIGRGLFQIEKVGTQNSEEDPSNIIDFAHNNKLEHIYVVENNLGGFIPLYKKLKDINVSLRFGWICNFVTDASVKDDSKSHKNVIFINSEKGYKLLIKLANKAQVDFFNKEPRLDYRTIHEYWDNEHLMLAVPFYDSFIHKNLTSLNPCIPDFGNIKPFFFVESNDLPFDNLIYNGIKNYVNSDDTIVKTKTVYYKNKKDMVFYQTFRLFNRKEGRAGTLESPSMDFFSSDEFSWESYLESKKEYNSNFEEFFKKPLELIFNGIRLPEFKMSEEDRKTYNVPQGASDTEILRILARAGYKDLLNRGKIPKDKSKEYAERVNKELDILEKTNFSPYIALVWDTVNVIKKSGSLKGPGRGSCAGSLINYLIGITEHIDPIKYSLFFERFISESRSKTTEIDGVKWLSQAPDIDEDFQPVDRQRVIDYLHNKYPGRFVKLGSFSTATTKALTNHVCKIIGGYDQESAKMISDNVTKEQGETLPPLECIEASEKYKEFAENNPLMFSAIRKLHNTIVNMTSHPSAYLISHDPLDEYFPIQVGKTKEGVTEIISSVDAEVSEASMLKLDILGLETISLVNQTAQLANFDLDLIDYDDYENIYSHFQNERGLSAPYGLFQISGDAALRGLNKIKPKNFEELGATLAICRPGAFAFLEKYADYVNGRIEKITLHPLFDDLLAPYAGVCIYQETLMQMFNRIGFSLRESDDIRRIVSKKDKVKIKEWEQKIYEKAKENGHPEDAAKIVWDIALASSSYSFNRSHSTSYAILAAQTVYLKFKFPLQFFLTCLRLSSEKQGSSAEEIAKIVPELRQFGIQLLPPSLKKSESDFTIEGNDIRFGLRHVKGVAEKAIPKINSFLDKEHSNKFQVFVAASQAKVDARILCALVESGCLDYLNTERQRLLLEVKLWKIIEKSKIEPAFCLENGEKYNYDLISMLKDFPNWVLNGKKIGKPSRLETIRKQAEPHIKMYHQNKKTLDISKYLWERELMGFSPSFMLKNLFSQFSYLKTLEEVKNSSIDEVVQCVVHVDDFKLGIGKDSGKKYLKFFVGDETGNFTAMINREQVDEYISKYGQPESGQVLYIKGGKGPDIIWAKEICPQYMEIVRRVNDLRKLKVKENSENSLDTVSNL